MYRWPHTPSLQSLAFVPLIISGACPKTSATALSLGLSSDAHGIQYPIFSALFIAVSQAVGRFRALLSWPIGQFLAPFPFRNLITP